jgi:vacuolar-type H+-ATPase catalytic subunit A/Vma1
VSVSVWVWKMSDKKKVGLSVGDPVLRMKKPLSVELGVRLCVRVCMCICAYARTCVSVSVCVRECMRVCACVIVKFVGPGLMSSVFNGLQQPIEVCLHN